MGRQTAGWSWRLRSQSLLCRGLRRPRSRARGDEQADIVGAGPCGLALARQLRHQRGVDALVFDRAAAPGIVVAAALRRVPVEHVWMLVASPRPTHVPPFRTVAEHDDMVNYFEDYVPHQALRLRLGVTIAPVLTATRAGDASRPQSCLPARNLAPAITGALESVLIVVINGDRLLRRICFPPNITAPDEDPAEHENSGSAAAENVSRRPRRRCRPRTRTVPRWRQRSSAASNRVGGHRTVHTEYIETACPGVGQPGQALPPKLRARRAAAC